MHSQSWESLTHMKTWLPIYLSMSLYMWMCLYVKGGIAGGGLVLRTKAERMTLTDLWEEGGNPYYFAEWISNLEHCTLCQWSPIFSAPGSVSWNTIFFFRWGGLDGFRMIQAYYIYCALYYYYINSTSGRQALDPGGWGHLHYVENFKKMQNSRVFLQRFWFNWSSL